MVSEPTGRTTKAWLAELGLRPRKKLGQNFLVDRHVLQRILAAAEIHSQDIVLEIGAGLGTLTQALAEESQRVVAVEVDEQLIAALRSRLQSFPNVQIIQGDILALDIASLVRTQPPPLPRRSGVDAEYGSLRDAEFGTPSRSSGARHLLGERVPAAQDLIPPRRSGTEYQFKVVANIPYYITSAVLRHLLEARAKPQLIVLMVQNEVAQRILATPGEMSLLAVSVQFYGQPRLVARVPARSFYPVPKVDSAIVRIDPHSQLPIGTEEIVPFFDTVRAGFGQRRKQLRNALSHGLKLPADRVVQAMHQAGIEERRRAETVSIAEWVALLRALWSEAAPA